MEKVALSVSQSIALINQTLDYAYPVILVEGEVSSFKVNRDKYVFFDLKDDEGSLGCFMTVWQLRMPLEDGMKVQLLANPRLTNWGKFSLTVREIRPVGEGSLKRSFDMLKGKLEAEGLFAPEKKRPLPRLPHRIGLIASAESAGYVDFLTILGARWGGMEISVANVQVQGMGAAEQIMRAIRHFNELAEPPEVLVLVRGGGSADDLAVFNDEPLVRAVAASRIPTLVGVGHEVDTSLVDLVADQRAATPSNAAERLVPDRREIVERVQVVAISLGDRLRGRLAALGDQTAEAPVVFARNLRRRCSAVSDGIAARARLLEQFNPIAVLARGYGLVRNQNRLVSNQQDVAAGDELQIELARLILTVGVKNVEKR